MHSLRRCSRRPRAPALSLGLLLASLLLGHGDWLAARPTTPAVRPEPAPPLPPPSLRFVAVGDTGAGNRGQLAVAAAMRDKCARDGCDFIQLLGDNIYESGVSSIYDYQWMTKFEEPYKDLKLPFYAILGNHDYGGNGGGNEPEKGLFQIQYTTRSSKWRMPGAFYMRRVANAELYAIDTTSLRLGRDVDAQRQEVRRWLAGPRSTWRITFGHHPWLSNGPHGKVDDGEPHEGAVKFRVFLEAELCGKVDLYISGHDHSRQWLADSCMGTDMVVSGAGSSATHLPGRNPTLFKAGTIGFLYVAITGKTLRAEFVNEEGKVEFARSMTK